MEQMEAVVRPAPPGDNPDASASNSCMSTTLSNPTTPFLPADIFVLQSTVVTVTVVLVAIPKKNTEASPVASSLKEVEHVVIFMQENRSWDTVRQPYCCSHDRMGIVNSNA